MRYALFLGCTVPVRAQHYELSARKVAEIFQMELADIPQFSCCGFPVKSTHAPTTALIAARNLALASELGVDICTLCSSCCSTLTEVNRRLKEDPLLRRELAKIEKTYTKPIEVKHFARVLYEDVGLDKIEGRIKRRLSPLRLAAHYGCHYVKPKEVFGFDEPEDPKTLDELVRVTGADVVEYEDKKMCCGGPILGIDEDDALKIARKKLDSVKKANADALVSICPFCSIMYEDNQRKIEARFETTYGLPVLYYPQLLGIALGIDPKDLGIRMNKVRLDQILSKLE